MTWQIPSTNICGAPLPIQGYALIRTGAGVSREWAGVSHEWQVTRFGLDWLCHSTKWAHSFSYRPIQIMCTARCHSAHSAKGGDLSHQNHIPIQKR